MSFVHLQTHSEYSMLRSSARVRELVNQAKILGQSAIALTDHNAMFGILDFYFTAKELGVKPIIGCHIMVEEMPLGPDQRNDKNLQRIVLLAENNAGYGNLVKLVSSRYESAKDYADPPLTSWSSLQKHREGLIALIGDTNSNFGADLAAQRIAQAERYAKKILDIFGQENTFLTLQDHGLAEQRTINSELVKLGKKHGIALVATNNVHYVKPADFQAHRVMLCIASATPLQRYEAKDFSTDQYYLKSTEEMAALFPQCPEALTNTLSIAQRCEVTLQTNVGDKYWPKFDFPNEFADSDAYLEHLTWQKLPARYPNANSEIFERARYELAMMKSMKVAGYMLITQDFINWARSRNIPVGPGRGSAAGSLVAYIIGITDIDPLLFGLLFERFLNPERVSMPDIDTDFSDKERHLVIQYVTEKYGESCVSQIVTYSRMKAKAAIRDVGRVLGLPVKPDVDGICKMIGTEPDINLSKAWEQNTALRDLINSQERYRELWRLSLELEGLIRQPGVHAAAVIIAPEPLSNLAPIYRTEAGATPVIQYDKKYAEEIGLLKMDFLGLRNLSVIQDTVEMIRQTRGLSVDVGKLDLSDTTTFALLGKGITVGVFQFESGGMQNYLRQLKPTRIEDLIAMNALFRPGPIEQIPRYIKSKHGEEPIECYHPDLEPVLGETYGVIVYQEQVMRIAQILAGFSLGGADNLRRVMSKKDGPKMEKLRPVFVEGAAKRGYDKAMAEKIWDYLVPFSNYAFNKSHSAAYSCLAYQTAYLKAHFGPEFMAANMTSEISDTKKLVGLIVECRKMGIRILHPNVNSSHAVFTVHNGDINYGLAGIRNVGLSIIEDMVEERNNGGYFISLFDLCKRVFQHQAVKDAQNSDRKNKRAPLNKRTLESLIMAGALDHLPGSRAQQHASVDKALEMASRDRSNMEKGQTSLFDLAGSVTPIIASDNELVDVETWTYSELLNKEKEVLGLFLSGHPLEEYKAELRGFTTCTMDPSLLSNLPLKSTVTLGGVIIFLRSNFSKKTEVNFGVGEIEDFDGQLEIFLPSDAFEKFRDKFSADSLVLVRGKIDRALGSKEDGKLQLVVEAMTSLEEARIKLARFIHVEVSSATLVEQTMRSLQEIAQAYAAGDEENGCHLVFHVNSQSNQTHILEARRYRIFCARELLKELGDLFGTENVWISHKIR